MPDLLDIIHREWPTIRSAPYSFVIAVFACAAILWAIFELRYRSRLTSRGTEQSSADTAANSSVANSGNSTFNQTFVFGDKPGLSSAAGAEDPIPYLEFIGCRRTSLGNDGKSLVERSAGAEAIVAEFRNTLQGVGAKTLTAYAVTAQLTFRTDKGGQVYVHHGTWIATYPNCAEFRPGKCHGLIVMTQNSYGVRFALENHNSFDPLTRRRRSGITMLHAPQLVPLPEEVYSVNIALLEGQTTLYQAEFVLASEPDGTMRLA